MIKNIGSKDKKIRIFIAIVLVLLNLTGIISGTLGTVSLILAAVLIVTSFTGFCGLYKLFGMNTCPVVQTSATANTEEAKNPVDTNTVNQ